MAGRPWFLPILLLGASVCSTCLAAPRLSVSVAGKNAHGNVEWLVQVAPDPVLFMDTNQGFGGSLDIELGLEVTAGSLVQAVPNPAWHEIPAYNPFTGGVTLGVEADLENEVVFTALGSDLLTSGALVDLLRIETSPNSRAMLSWGGHTHWPGLPQSFVGGRITQAGMTFDGLRGGRTWLPGTAGDYNASGLVEQADLSLVLISWGLSADPPPAGWLADMPSGVIDQAELDRMLANWGRSAPATTAVAAQAVPEPSTVLLLTACGLVLTFYMRAETEAAPG